jgi:hypothetical protein
MGLNDENTMISASKNKNENSRYGNFKNPEKQDSAKLSVSPTKSILKNGTNRYMATLQEQNKNASFGSNPQEQILTNRSQNYIGRSGYKGVYRHAMSPREFKIGSNAQNNLQGGNHQISQKKNNVEF